MKLEPSAMTYEFTDPSGYGFTVDCTFEKDRDGRELGWSAEVVMKTAGSVTPEAAVEHLALSAREFLIQLKAKGGKL